MAPPWPELAAGPSAAGGDTEDTGLLLGKPGHGSRSVGQGPRGESYLWHKGGFQARAEATLCCVGSAGTSSPHPFLNRLSGACGPCRVWGLTPCLSGLETATLAPGAAALVTGGSSLGPRAPALCLPQSNRSHRLTTPTPSSSKDQTRSRPQDQACVLTGLVFQPQKQVVDNMHLERPPAQEHS